MIQKLFEKILKILTKAALKKQRPKVVTITGSVGKSSTKEAIYSVLKTRFRVRRSRKNYNNEIGLPLTVMGQHSPGKSIVGWLGLFYKFLGLILFEDKNYPEVLVLEVGADRPGDLKYLMRMLPKGLLKTAVLTAVTPAHLEFFGSMENILKEKLTTFFYLTENGFAVLDTDNCDFQKVKEHTEQAHLACKFITYSIEHAADVAAVDLKVEEGGVAFTIKHQGNSAEFLLKEAVSPHQVYALLAGLCVGFSLGMGFAEAISGLENYSILPGRMRKIQGIKQSLIIDDTYNSSPTAAAAALRALSALPFGRRRIAVLGDMLEMGPLGEKLHRQIGKIAAGSELDYLFTFGKQAEFISKQAIKEGMRESAVSHFFGQMGLCEHLQELIQPGDVVLIKASQGMRLEKVTKALMMRPKKAAKLLVRQNKKWLKK